MAIKKKQRINSLFYHILFKIGNQKNREFILWQCHNSGCHWLSKEMSISNQDSYNEA